MRQATGVAVIPDQHFAYELTGTSMSSRMMLHPIPRALAIFAKARLHCDDETSEPSLVSDLHAACHIFRVNGREREACMAEAQLPAALLGVGQFGKATSLALELFDRADLPAADRLKLGTLAVMRLAPSRHSAEFGQLLQKVNALGEMLSPCAELLHIRADLTLYKLHVHLGEVGMRTYMVSASPGLLTTAPDAVRQQAHAWHAELSELSGRLTGGDHLPLHVKLVMSLLSAVAGSPEQIATVFERVRAEHAGKMIVTSLLLEGQAHAWAGRLGEAADRLDKASRMAETSGRRDLVSMIEFELSSVLATLGRTDAANRHALAYFKLVLEGEPSLIQLQAWRRRREDEAYVPQPDEVQGSVHPWMRQTEPPFLRRVCSFIGRSFSSAITPAELVAHSKVSRRSLEVAFRTYRGTTPLGYLKAFRLDEACRLLNETDLPLNEIRAAVGYSCAASFSTDFRKRFGIPPSAVR